MNADESELAAFLKERIKMSRGSVQLQYLVGVLPQLRSEIRTNVANNSAELMKFLLKHSNLFEVDANANVKLKDSFTSSHEEKLKLSEAEEENVCTRTKNDILPAKIEGEGIVSKISVTFGFISAKSPFKTVIYFTPASFGDMSKTLFTDFDGLAPGKKICFFAKKSNNNHNSKYRAIKVWYPKNVTNDESCAPNLRKTRETGLYDPLSLESEGTIIKLFSNFGFIAVDNDKNNTVYFHKSQLANFQNIVDLTKALQIGNLVAFKAMRTVKSDIKARWSANKVWVIKGGKTSAVSDASKFKRENERQILKNESGKIFSNPSGTIIKFGNKFEKVADADSSLFYMFGTKVKDVSWEFSDSDNVRFDAIEIKSHPGWKALLVWTGDRPDVVLDTDLGDFSDFSCEVDNSQDVSCNISKSSYNLTKLSESSLKNSNSKSSGYSSFKDTSINSKYQKSVNTKNSSSERLHRDFDNDDFSDSTSYTSNRSSNVSTVEINGSFFEKRRNRHSSRDPHKENNHIKGKMSKNSSVGKKIEEKSRIQRHLEFISSDIKGSLDNIEDNKSVCSSASTEKLNNAYPLNETAKIYKNWGDSPYPGDDSEEMDIAEDSVHNKSKNNASDNFLQCPSPILSEISTTGSDHSDLFHNKMYNENFNGAVVEENFTDVAKELSESSGSLHELLKDDEQTVEENNEPKKMASVKCFHEIEGTVKKVYCKYAEIESSKLSKPSSFFCSDYYQDGYPIIDEFDDLREVLKVGDVLKFNCIEVIDNDGMCFIKPTVLWKGKKPNLVEMTPEQYISQNNLTVSVNKDNFLYYDSNECFSSIETKLPDVPIIESELPVKKFLTVVNNRFENDEVEDTFENIFCESDTPESVYNKHLKINEVNENPDELVFSVGKDDGVINGICNIIKHKMSLINPMVDLTEVSEEIFHFVLKSTDSHKYQSHLSDTMKLQKETQTEAFKMSSVCGDLQVDKKDIEIVHTESQTIFTGEVIGKSVYFDEH